MENSGVPFPEDKGPEVFVAGMDENSRAAAFAMVNKLRTEGVSAECDHMGKSLKAQFKYADKIGARYVIALGSNELECGECNVKCMADGSVRAVKLCDVCECLKKQN